MSLPSTSKREAMAASTPSSSTKLPTFEKTSNLSGEPSGLQKEEVEEEEEEQDEEEEEEVYSENTRSNILQTEVPGVMGLSHENMEEEELDVEEAEAEGYGHEYFCEVAEEFIEDDFNLTGLSALVPFYREAMEMVLDVEAEEESHRVPDVSIVESSAELLYGLIHQRYIITRQGLQQMYAKFEANHFGHCPRVYCTQGKLLPCGRSDLPGVDTVKLYCPNCVDMYVPPSSRFLSVDGAFFGTTFPHLLFQTYPQAHTAPPAAPPIENSSLREPTKPETSLSKVYIPRIYGFKVSEKARSGPRMQWLRMRPRVEGEPEWKNEDERNEVDEDAFEPEDPKSAGERKGGPPDRGRFDDGEDDEDEDEEEEEEEEEEEKGDERTTEGRKGAAMATSEAMKMSGVLDSPSMDDKSTLPTVDTVTVVERPLKPLPRPITSPSAAHSRMAPELVPAEMNDPSCAIAETRTPLVTTSLSLRRERSGKDLSYALRDSDSSFSVHQHHAHGFESSIATTVA